MDVALSLRHFLATITAWRIEANRALERTYISRCLWCMLGVKRCCRQPPALATLWELAISASQSLPVLMHRRLLHLHCEVAHRLAVSAYDAAESFSLQLLEIFWIACQTNRFIQRVSGFMLAQNVGVESAFVLLSTARASNGRCSHSFSLRHRVLLANCISLAICLVYGKQLIFVELINR